MLAVNNLSYEFPEKILFNQISFDLEPGKLLHLVGDNGIGKSTLIKILTGLYLPTEGSIVYCGKNINQQMPIYQQHLVYLGHSFGINTLLTIEEHCRYDLNINLSDEQLKDLLLPLNLHEHLTVGCAYLSAGQKKRLSLLKLCIKPQSKIWFLDEPFSALDTHGYNWLVDLMNHFLSHGGMIICTSHQSIPINSTMLQEYRLK